jgi:hypothetical protein
MIATSQNFPVLNMNIFAFTQPVSRPAYISVNQSGEGFAKVSVRSRDTDVASEIGLSKEEAVKLANQLLSWAGEAPAPAKVDVKEMVNRFLGWRLPSDFYPDCYVSFDSARAKLNSGWPTGTNLFHAGQATAMFDYCVNGVKP